METKQSIEFKLNQLSTRTVDVPQTFNGAVTINDNLTVDQGTTTVIILSNLPTTDPAVAGQLWSDSGVLTVSAG